MGHIDLILNSKSRTPTSSLIEPEWELDSRVPEGKLTVEQFNWNDVGYDLVGPEDYSLRVYADQYGNLLYDDKGGTGAVVDFAPQVPVTSGTNHGESVGVSGVTGGVIKLLGHHIPVTNDNLVSQGEDGSWINTHYVPPVDNKGEFTWTLLIKIDPEDPAVLTQYSTDNNVVPALSSTIIGNYRHEPTETGLAYVAMWITDVGEIRISERNVDGTDDLYVTTTFQVDDGDWHRLVFVGTSTEGILYIDGAEDGRYTRVTGVVTDTEDGTTNKLPVIINGALNRYWQGEISDVRLYERALSATEVESLGNTPDTSVVYLNFASPLMILHTDGPTRDSLTTSITRSNKFQYIQLFVRESSAYSMRILQVRLLNNSGNNVFQDNTILVPTDATNSLAVGTNPSAKQVKASDDIADIIDNQALTDVAVGDTTDTLDEVVQLKLNRAYSFDEFRRLEVYFTDEQGPYEIRFLNENYELINNNVLYTSESPPSFAGTNNTLIILKMLGANPMTGFTAGINDTINTYVLAWADESTLTTDFKYRKVAEVNSDILLGLSPIPIVPRNRSLAMVLPRGYELLQRWRRGVFQIGPSDYTLRIYADKGGSLLYDDKGSVTGGGLNFNPDGDNTLVQGKAGGIIDFAGLDSGSVGSYIDTNYFPPIDNKAEFTWTTLFKSDDTANDQVDPSITTNIFGTSAHDTSVNAFITLLLKDGGSGNPPFLSISERGADLSGHIVVNSTFNICDTNWHRLVFRSIGGVQQLWIDGVKDIEYTKVATDLTESTPKPVIINGQSQRYWHGEMSDIRFYERALTDLEIATLGTTPDTSVYYEPLQGTYEPQYPLIGVKKQNDNTVGFKFEKSNGSAITESEIPSSYSLKCKICTC